jgi:hypothetical protein
LTTKKETSEKMGTTSSIPNKNDESGSHKPGPSARSQSPFVSFDQITDEIVAELRAEGFGLQGGSVPDTHPTNFGMMRLGRNDNQIVIDRGKTRSGRSASREAVKDVIESVSARKGQSPRPGGVRGSNASQGTTTDQKEKKKDKTVKAVASARRGSPARNPVDKGSNADTPSEEVSSFNRLINDSITKAVMKTLGSKYPPLAFVLSLVGQILLCYIGVFIYAYFKKDTTSVDPETKKSIPFDQSSAVVNIGTTLAAVTIAGRWCLKKNEDVVKFIMLFLVCTVLVIGMNFSVKLALSEPPPTEEEPNSSTTGSFYTEEQKKQDALKTPSPKRIVANLFKSALRTEDDFALSLFCSVYTAFQTKLFDNQVKLVCNSIGLDTITEMLLSSFTETSTFLSRLIRMWHRKDRVDLAGEIIKKTDKIRSGTRKVTLKQFSIRSLYKNNFLVNVDTDGKDIPFDDFIRMTALIGYVNNHDSLLELETLEKSLRTGTTTGTTWEQWSADTPAWITYKILNSMFPSIVTDRETALKIADGTYDATVDGHGKPPQFLTDIVTHMKREFSDKTIKEGKEEDYFQKYKENVKKLAE